MRTYYVLTVQPDEPVTFRFAAKQEYDEVRQLAEQLPEIIIDEQASGPVEYSTPETAGAFLKAVWA